LRAGRRTDFSALRSALPRRTDDLVIFAFDVLWTSEHVDVRPYPLETRKTVLRQLLDAGSDEARTRFRWVDEFAGAEPRALFQAACELGLRGIFSKRWTRRIAAGAAKNG
jgi:ATP-dependent DNA ligase